MDDRRKRSSHGTKTSGSFDAFALARNRGVVEGLLDVAAAERLEDRVAPGEGTVAWRIEGTTDARGRPALSIALEGTVPLECQRCLAPFEFVVAQRTLAVLARSEAEADDLDAESDDEVLLADRTLDPAQLVEDELLLTLPYAPKHADGACGS